MMVQNTNSSEVKTEPPMFRRIQLRNNCNKREAASSIRWKEYQDLSISEVWKRYPKIEGNNAVICGAANPDDPFLYVIDFDRTRSEEHFNETSVQQYASTIEFLANTLDLIKKFFKHTYFYFLITGSKGAHFYFYVNDGWEHKDELGNTSTPVKIEGLPLNGIDTRGQGGFVFGKGSDFSEYELKETVKHEGKPNESRKWTYHLGPYIHPKLFNASVPCVSFAEIQKFLDYVKANKYTEETPAKSTRMPDDICKVDALGNIKLNVAPKKKSVYSVSCRGSFEIYEKILSGEYIINHLSQAGIDEFRIWNALWLYIYHNKMDFEECKR
jgi:hypothetical protein